MVSEGRQWHFQQPNGKRRAKLKTKGKVLFQTWVTKGQTERIRVVLGGVTYHAPAPAPRKRRKLHPVQKKNRGLFEAHQVEIRARRASDEKPSHSLPMPMPRLPGGFTGANRNG